MFKAIVFNRGLKRRVVVAAVVGLVAVPGMSVGAGVASADGEPALVSHWRLDERAGTVTVDSVTHRRGRLNNGAAFAAGRIRGAVALDGTDDFVAGPVCVQTDSSFTVAAWVNLSEKPVLGDEFSVISTAVSIDGERTSKFRIGHVVDNDTHPRGAWLFEMPESDTDDAEVLESAASVEPSEVSTWVHLVGVYDAPNHKTWLYVNGARVDDGTVGTPWQPTQGLRIGRGKVNGAPAQFWPGSVDDVRVYLGALDASAVSRLYSSFPPG